MLLMQEPQLLLVDEPVAGMTPQETERTAELLMSLAGEHSVVVVEHDMDFVRSIARKVTVLHEGSVLAEGSMDQVQNDPRSSKCIWANERGRHAIHQEPGPVLRRQPYAVGRHDGDPEGLGHVPHGPQRHGQDHAAPLRDGAGRARSRARLCTKGKDLRAVAGRAARAARHRLCAAGARDFRAAHRRRESAHRAFRAADAVDAACRSICTRCSRC